MAHRVEAPPTEDVTINEPMDYSFTLPQRCTHLICIVFGVANWNHVISGLCPTIRIYIARLVVLKIHRRKAFYWIAYILFCKYWQSQKEEH